MARKKKVSPGNRLVAYYRYSGGSQQTEQSIEGQRRDCEAYARQHGLTIVHEYIDRPFRAVVLNPGWLFSR